MLVRDRMTTTPITVMPDTPFMAAVRLMHKHRFRRLPVVDEEGRLIGIVTERDLLFALPSPSSSPSALELDHMLFKLRVGEIMIKNVISIQPDVPIEEAARVILEKKIGGLPVVADDNTVVGVITESDIFRTFVETFGYGDRGVRLSLNVDEGEDVFTTLSDLIHALGGRLVSVGSFKSEDPHSREYVVKLSGVTLLDSITALGDRIIDVREV